MAPAPNRSTAAETSRWTRPPHPEVGGGAELGREAQVRGQPQVQAQVEVDVELETGAEVQTQPRTEGAAGPQQAARRGGGGLGACPGPGLLHRLTARGGVGGGDLVTEFLLGQGQLDLGAQRDPARAEVIEDLLVGTDNPIEYPGPPNELDAPRGLLLAAAEDLEQVGDGLGAYPHVQHLLAAAVRVSPLGIPRPGGVEDAFEVQGGLGRPHVLDLLAPLAAFVLLLPARDLEGQGLGVEVQGNGAGLLQVLAPGIERDQLGTLEFGGAHGASRLSPSWTMCSSSNGTSRPVPALRSAALTLLTMPFSKRHTPAGAADPLAW